MPFKEEGVHEVGHTGWKRFTYLTQDKKREQEKKRLKQVRRVQRKAKYAAQGREGE
jgi:hypothetical protein